MVGSYLLLLCMYASRLISLLSLQIYIMTYFFPRFTRLYMENVAVTCSFLYFYTSVFCFTDLIFLSLFAR